MITPHESVWLSDSLTSHVQFGGLHNLLEHNKLWLGVEEGGGGGEVDGRHTQAAVVGMSQSSPILHRETVSRNLPTTRRGEGMRGGDLKSVPTTL